jgi:hypothetical protein
LTTALSLFKPPKGLPLFCGIEVVCQLFAVKDGSNKAAKMADVKKAPVFKKVADLRPGTHGHNLHVKVKLTNMPAAAQEASPPTC